MSREARSECSDFKFDDRSLKNSVMPETGITDNISDPREVEQPQPI